MKVINRLNSYEIAEVVSAVLLMLFPRGLDSANWDEGTLTTIWDDDARYLLAGSDIQACYEADLRYEVDDLIRYVASVVDAVDLEDYFYEFDPRSVHPAVPSRVYRVLGACGEADPRLTEYVLRARHLFAAEVVT